MTKKNNSNDDLIGFQDFIDSQQIQIPPKPSRETNTHIDILTFLERESNRLSKGLELCSKTTIHLKNYPQGEDSLDKLEELIDLKKKEVIKKLSEKNSPLYQNLDDLLQGHFNF